MIADNIASTRNVFERALAAGARRVVYTSSAGGGLYKSTDYGRHWTSIGDRLPTLMVGSVGFPFLMLSTTAPLLQRWFAARTESAAVDPYRLGRV